LFAEATQDTEQKPAPRKRRTQQSQPIRSTPVPVRQQAPATPPAAKHERTEIAAHTAPASSELVLADNTSAVGRYQAREAQSQAQQQFAGGDAIVIGAGTLVVIILIVLLVLLLV
jgi:cobalamin biosynthesis Mg chelatase CobN